MLSRRSLLIAGSSACATLALPRLACAREILTAADVHIDGYPTVEAVKWIGRELERETGGRLSVRIYHSGQLGRETDTVNLARFGALDFTRVNLAALNNAFPATQILSLPYVFDSTEHMRRSVDGPVGAEILAAFEARGLVGLAFYDSGARCFFNTHRPISAPAELHGLKIRVPPSDIFMDLIRALGANPTPLAFGEIFSSLQTRLIDGAENNWRSFHTSRHFEVARYWAQTEHSYSPEALLLSRRRFDSLAPSDRELLVDLARRSVPYMRELWDRTEAESRAFVIANGVSVSEIDRPAFERAAAPMLRAHLREPQLDRMYRAIRAQA